MIYQMNDFTASRRTDMKYSHVYHRFHRLRIAAGRCDHAGTGGAAAAGLRDAALAEGQLEALTGISERRWWEPGYPLSHGAVRRPARRLAMSSVRP